MEFDDPSKWASIDRALKSSQSFSESLGFSRFMINMNFLRPPSHLIRAELTSFPQAWLDVYERREYALTSPIVRRMRQSTSPFSWDECDWNSARAAKILHDATVHGVNHGFTVPMYCPGGELIALSLAGKQMPRSSTSRWKLYQACYQFLCQVNVPLRKMALHNKAFIPFKKLTKQQNEAMLLLMDGMSINDIAQCLNLHIRSAEGRLCRAFSQLGTTSREQAIVRALTSRQIDMLSDAVQAYVSVERYVHQPMLCFSATRSQPAVTR